MQGAAHVGVDARWPPPLSIQWLRDGAPIPGATNATYTRTDLRTSVEGAYSVEVSSLLGSVRSRTAHVTFTLDLTGPVLVRNVGLAGDPHLIMLSFDEPIDVTLFDDFGVRVFPVGGGNSGNLIVKPRPIIMNETNVVIQTVDPRQPDVSYEVCLDSSADIRDACAGIPAADNTCVRLSNPRILSIKKSNEVSRVTFTSEPGLTYTLQSRVVANGPWTNVASMRVAGTGQNLEVMDSAGSVPRRFYRVLADSFAVNEAGFVTDFNAGLPAGATLAHSGAGPGPAVIDGVLRLTEAVPDQNNMFFVDAFSGSDPVTSFTATFRVRLGDVSPGGPADGFSFSFGPQVDGTPFIGEEGVPEALRVSFDTWDNGPAAPFFDLDAPAIDVFYGSQRRATVSMAGNRQGGHAPATPIPIEPATSQPMLIATGGTWANVQIRLDPDGTMDVWYKDVKVLDNVATGYVPAAGRFAFGARTGGAWTTHYIDDLQIIVTH